MKCKLSFKDKDNDFITEIPEEVIEEQMKRPPNKRLYTCGIQFTEVVKAEILK